MSKQTNNNQKQNNNKTTVASLISWCFFGVVFCLLMYVLGCRVTGNAPTFFGYSFHIVVTQSMEPEIKVGDFVVSKKCDINDVEINDDILFKSTDPSLKGIIIVHRVIEKSSENGEINLITKGINNDSADRSPVIKENLLGKVVSTDSGLGSIAKFLFNGYTLFFVLILAVLVFIMAKQIKNIKTEIDNYKKTETDKSPSVQQKKED
jgi:signal peptidase